jgi:UDP-2,4-diacetamido-2,4,6-trideoxy-beta-L-altropyranose hydrolase
VLAERETLLVRADATSRIGMGHFMRSLALAEQWKAQGGEAVFLSRCENRDLRERLDRREIELLPIEEPHPAPGDLHQTRDALGEYGASWLVVDGYNFDPDYHLALRRDESRLLIIDDCADLQAYHADIVLNQNISANKLSYPCGADTALLLGNDYALLRTEFTGWDEWMRVIPDRAENILVTLGGSDPDLVTLDIIDALAGVPAPALQVKVVVGNLNRHGAEIRLAAASCPTAHAIEVVPPVDDMSALMIWADVAISAAGSTCWELASVGLPSLLVVLSPDQLAIAQGMDQTRAAIYVEDRTGDEIARTLSALVEDRDRRAGISRKCREFIDGHGAERVVTAMVKMNS